MSILLVNVMKSVIKLLLFDVNAQKNMLDFVNWADFITWLQTGGCCLQGTGLFCLVHSVHKKPLKEQRHLVAKWYLTYMWQVRQHFGTLAVIILRTFSQGVNWQSYQRNCGSKTLPMTPIKLSACRGQEKKIPLIKLAVKGVNILSSCVMRSCSHEKIL